ALVDRAGPRGNDPRPADREAIRAEAELAHELDVLPPAVIVVAGDVAGLAGGDRAGAPAELIPDGRSLPVLVVRALELVCRGGGRVDSALARREVRRWRARIGVERPLRRRVRGVPRESGATVYRAHVDDRAASLREVRDRLLHADVRRAYVDVEQLVVLGLGERERIA